MLFDQRAQFLEPPEQTIQPTLFHHRLLFRAADSFKDTTLIRYVNSVNYRAYREKQSNPCVQETDCQVYHVCGSEEGRTAPISSLLCPNGTLYNQQYFVCDWWFNVDCSVVRFFFRFLV